MDHITKYKTCKGVSFFKEKLHGLLKFSYAQLLRKIFKRRNSAKYDYL